MLKRSQIHSLATNQTIGDILIQFPVYNEATVVESSLDAINELHWPHGQLRLHILDDSTDHTTDIIERWVQRNPQSTLHIEHIRRSERTGYKAGALAYSVSNTQEEFICIFDADFQPSPTFLVDTMPLFASKTVGMVQTRWSHLNREQNWLTKAASVILDGHFIIEHTGRFLKRCFFNFNGTAGIWRRQCIEDAGGWHWDTITEDLDLSYRAQLRGWDFVYTPLIHVPAEIPSSISAIRSQQFRWVRGTSQTARKLLPQIWASEQSVSIKVEASMHLLANLGYWMTLILSLVIPFTAHLRWQFHEYWMMLDAVVFVASFASLIWFHRVSQQFLSQQKEQTSGWIAIVIALVLGVGLAVWQSWALWLGLTTNTAIFERTPKHGTQVTVYKTPRSTTAWWMNRITILLGTYSVWGIYWSCIQGHYPSIPFQLIFAMGYLWVGLGSLLEET
jgi:cellulose synthase/poly-beta-1,6-N-acetylglucosamine synthase-like glycosyltransferase